jgi:hypothetical protein
MIAAISIVIEAKSIVIVPNLGVIEAITVTMAAILLRL